MVEKQWNSGIISFVEGGDMFEPIKEIYDELKRAEKKHPNWPTDIIHAAAIVNEESGELIRAALNHHYFGESKEEIRKEAIQTAAACIRLLKNL